MKFEALNLTPDLLKGIQDIGFERCTPIQEQSLPQCLAGMDLIAQSQTGTGKTAVFLLTIFNRLAEQGTVPKKKPRALIMVPTRELATQVEKDAGELGRHLPFRHVAIYGGVQYEKQIGALTEGVDLVVATPGRMIDLYKSKALSLDEIEIFVVDEADRMFDMGFAPDIRYIANRLPKKKPRQTMLFSATIDANVRRLASQYMLPDPVMIEIEPEQVTVDTIDQKVIYVSNEEKLPVLMALLKRPDAERVIVFTNMKRTAEMLEWKLTGNGFPASVLTGDVSQSKRERVINNMKSGKLKILVATDVAARGLHIEGISHVVNYDLPDDSANYVHRIGRTARAGHSGKSYSLVCEDHVFNLPEIEKYIERKIESEWIEDSEMVEDKAGPAPRRKPRTQGGVGRSRGAKGSAKGGRGGRAAKPSASGEGGRTSGPGEGQRRRRRPGSGKPPAKKEGAEGAAQKPDAKAGQGTGTPAAEGRKGTRPRRRRRPSAQGTGQASGSGASKPDSCDQAPASARPRQRRKPGTANARGRGRERGKAPESGTTTPVSYARPEHISTSAGKAQADGATGAAATPKGAEGGKDGVVTRILNIFRKKS